MCVCVCTHVCLCKSASAHFLYVAAVSRGMNPPHLGGHHNARMCQQKRMLAHTHMRTSRQLRLTWMATAARSRRTTCTLRLDSSMRTPACSTTAALRAASHHCLRAGMGGACVCVFWCVCLCLCVCVHVCVYVRACWGVWSCGRAEGWPAALLQGQCPEGGS